MDVKIIPEVILPPTPGPSIITEDWRTPGHPLWAIQELQWSWVERILEYQMVDPSTAIQEFLWLEKRMLETLGLTFQAGMRREI